ncbi:hypothetical protein SCHPADRAFT_819355 [Schizopora paradoxa]|uniref:Uncharacterized protein n=1 Tax=Schizopora paradoxa TaxID=27342 RepID=A0A0H2S327_9AGAM|nr:hypothetical protein SCHPADRAFT_819355 [Schizopora paradoxa]
MEGGNGKGVISRYRATLGTISARTGTALPSLITSFAILHEVTAVLPLVAVFYAARSAGVGEQVIHAVQTSTQVSNSDASANAAQRWLKQTGREWMGEGEQWVGRVGRHYGIWGFEKRKKGEVDAQRDAEKEELVMKNITGDIANALVAYGVTKAILPLRIGFSLYFSPAFSRRVVDPISSGVMRIFRRGNRP